MNLPHNKPTSRAFNLGIERTSAGSARENQEGFGGFKFRHFEVRRRTEQFSISGARIWESAESCPWCPQGSGLV